MRRLLIASVLLLIALIIAVSILTFTGVRYAYEPSQSNVISRTRPSPEPYDLWGQTYSLEQAKRSHLSPAMGAVRVDDRLLRLGRHAFYKETFKNEVFLTDIIGILNGPLRITNVAKAILALRGKATANLRVEVPYTITIGNRTFQKGEYFDTGLDVPRGALVPLGMSLSVSRWHIRVGITCAACHATVDPVSGKVIEGAPNQDLNAGLLLALGTNSAAYFMHTDVHPQNMDIAALENAIDTELMMWPRGSFDSLTDLKADPTQIPTSFTWGGHPFGWSGNFMAGPFRGLTSQNNNVHALNSDSLLLADASPTLFGIDKGSYLAILLRNASSSRYRFNPASGKRPSEFLAALAPTPGSPGINEVVLPPTYPKGTILSPDGTLTSSPGYHVWEQNNAMSAWQDTLVPPAPAPLDPAVKSLGKQVFERAQCTTCHSGSFLTNHQVIAASVLATNPVRAAALQKTELNFAPPVLFTFDTPVPLPPHPRPLPVPTNYLDPAQIDLAWAHHGSAGGYKVPSLIGLNWSAPYLHDGGVAVGLNPNSDLGLPGTVQRNNAPDPTNSLRALIDRNLRARVVAANEASPELRRMNVEGVGHNFWVDAQSGFTRSEQRALIAYLLTYEPGED